MRKNFVLDTTVLLHDPDALYKFTDNQVLIPLVVVEEIDKFKRDQSDLGRNARTVSRYLDRERQKGSLNQGVDLDCGGNLRVVLESDDIHVSNQPRSTSMTNDNWILGVAVRQTKKNEGPAILITKDANLRIKADALGIQTEDYSNDKVKIDELYSGFANYAISAAEEKAWRQHGWLPAPEGSLLNQFLHLCKEDGSIVGTGRIDPDTRKLVPMRLCEEVWGIRPLNAEQRLALDLLLDPRVCLVSLVGKAGTGKTLLALASGLQLVVDQNKYNRLMVGRPIHPLGKDIGYLPGDIDEKIRPWMQPIFDNLEYILHCTSEETIKGHMTYQYFIDKGWMVVEPLTYMRGRSIPNQYMLVDEAQNLTPHEIKSIVTRAGHGTKIVLTGDPHQIDHPFLDASTNGISYLVQRMKDQHLFGHVVLSQGERSELSECASNLL